MSTKYEYQDLIDELKDEVGAGSLQKDEIIQVLRAETPDESGYTPIYDWYYNKETMNLELQADKSDNPEEIKDKKLLKEQYKHDQALLQDMKVQDVLSEMFEKTED